VDITQFGARPDGVSDTTHAIQAAVASKACRGAAQCVVYIPPGKYAIKQQVIITDPVILRGAGRDRTTLYFPYSLKEIKQDFSASNPWFFERLLEFRGSNDIIHTGVGATKLASISKLSRRGSSRVYVDKPRAIRKGQQVHIVASDHGEDGEDCLRFWQRLLPLMNASLQAPGHEAVLEAATSRLLLLVSNNAQQEIVWHPELCNDGSCCLRQWQPTAYATAFQAVLDKHYAMCPSAAVTYRDPHRPQHHTTTVLPVW
jgi:hypothetical protein